MVLRVKKIPLVFRYITSLLVLGTKKHKFRFAWIKRVEQKKVTKRKHMSTQDLIEYPIAKEQRKKHLIK